jgi:hypothetical protein
MLALLASWRFKINRGAVAWLAEDVDGAGVRGRIVGGVAIDAGSSTVFATGSDDEEGSDIRRRSSALTRRSRYHPCDDSVPINKVSLSFGIANVRNGVEMEPPARGVTSNRAWAASLPPISGEATASKAWARPLTPRGSKLSTRASLRPNGVSCAQHFSPR